MDEICGTAAAVVVVLMGAGWIFLKDDITKAPPVAVIEPQKVPVIDKSKEAAPRVIENKEAVISGNTILQKNYSCSNGSKK